MSRLKGCRIYLAGTMEQAADTGITWRREITPRLEAIGLRVFDPTNRPCRLSFAQTVTEETAIMRQVRADGKYDKLAEYMSEIVHQDLRMIDISDIVLVHIDADVSTVGTIDEFVTASNQRKPTLMVCAQGLGRMPLWFWGRVGQGWKHYMHENMEDCLARLEKIAYCQESELPGLLDPKRWLFLDGGNENAVHPAK